MPRVHVPSIPEDQTTVEITGESARYLTSVLRLRAGDEFELFDSAGVSVGAVVTRAGRGRVEAEMKLPRRSLPEFPANVVLLQGMLKGRKMDLLVQKTTELGVKEIVPLVTQRALVRQTRKVERWRKIALEASRQCGRAKAPSVSEPVDIRDFMRPEGKLSGYIFWEEGGRALSEMPPSSGVGDVVAAVGPEGGFTGEEVRLAEKSGLVVTTLGSRILRAETAAIAAVALVQFMRGGLGH
jgi:16S rRNA (uracil1498-N3)-methyltransferase